MKHTITLLLLCIASTLLAQQPENEKTLRIGHAVMHPDDFNNATSGVLPIADSIAMTLHTTHKYVALAEQVYWHIDTSASSKITFHPAPPNLHFHYILTFSDGQTYTCPQNTADIYGSYMHLLLKGTLTTGKHIQTADEALLPLLLAQPLRQITLAHAYYSTTAPPADIVMQPSYTISFSKAEAEQLQMAIRIATL